MWNSVVLSSIFVMTLGLNFAVESLNINLILFYFVRMKPTNYL